MRLSCWVLALASNVEGPAIPKESACVLKTLADNARQIDLDPILSRAVEGYRPDETAATDYIGR